MNLSCRIEKRRNILFPTGGVAQSHAAKEAILTAINAGAAGKRRQTPVEPKPPAPRTVSVTSLISATRTCVTGAITIWAIRIPRLMTKSSSPRLISSTFTSPR